MTAECVLVLKSLIVKKPFLSFQMYIMCCVGSSGGRLMGPLLSLSLVSLAVLTGINRVAEYRNHWSDVIAGQGVGGAIAVFLVSY